MRHIYTFIGSIVFCLISSASYTQITSTNFSASKDAYIASNAVSSNFGSSALLHAGRFLNKSMYTNRSSIEFDISSIPTNAVIVSASLKVYQNSSVGSPVTHVGRHTSSWTESGITWNNQPAYETNDLITSSSVVSSWLTVDVKNHVQKMVAGVYPNNGWLLKDNNEASSLPVSRTLASKEDANSARRPVLAVSYYIPIRVTDALISHESNSGANDGSVSPTLANGPGGLSYIWYNANGTTVSTSLNLSGVPYGWYGLKVSSTNTSDIFSYAFLVGLDCQEVTVEFRSTPEYTSNAYMMDLIRSGINYGDLFFPNMTNLITERWTWTNWYNKNSLLKFNLWMDPSIEVTQADMSLQGLDHSTLQGSNAAKLIKVTDSWNENLVAWNNSPATSASITANINATASTTEDTVVNLIDFWEEWKTDNSSNFGMSFELQNTTQYYHRQSYHSPNAASTLDRPVITFKLDLTRKGSFLTKTLDTLKQIGSITVDIDTICDKTPPYYYMIAPDTIPDLGEIYNFTKDSIFNGNLDSLDFYNFGSSSITHSFDSLTYGMYVVSVFDADGTRLFDEEVQLMEAFTFETQTNLAIDEFSIEGTGSAGAGSLELFTYEDLNSELPIAIESVNSDLFIGYSELATTIATYQDLEYGFYLTNDTLYTVREGVLSVTFTTPLASEDLYLKISEGQVKLSIPSGELLAVPLPAEYNYKVALGMGVGTKINLKPYKPFFKKHKFFAKLTPATCDSGLGSFNFSVAYFATPSIVPLSYVVTDEEQNIVVSNSQASTMTSYQITNLPAGIYSVTYYINGVGPFTGEVWLGNQVVWNALDIVDFDLDPNSYSVLRTLPSNTSTSLSRSDNVLSASQAGWVEFKPLIGGTLEYSLMRFSTQNIASPALAPTEDFLAFFRFLGMQLMYGQMDNVFVPLSPIPLNTQVKVQFLSTETNIWVNNTLWTTPATTANTHLIRCQTTFQDFGFENVVASFCYPVQPLSQIGYTELKRQVDGGYAHAVEGTVKFTFDEEYDIDAGDFVALKIYNNSNTQMYNGTISESYVFDDIRVDLDISGMGLTLGEFYIIEVLTSTGEKLYLRFLYKN